jgi:cytidylate kinase
MFELLGYAITIWFLYRVVTVWLTVHNIKSSTAESIEQHHKMVVFEQVEQNGHNVVLCYDVDNNFVAQADTKEQVIALAQQRYPKINISTYKNEELQWIKIKSDNN